MVQVAGKEGAGGGCLELLRYYVWMARKRGIFWCIAPLYKSTIRTNSPDAATHVIL